MLVVNVISNVWRLAGLTALGEVQAPRAVSLFWAIAHGSGMHDGVDRPTSRSERLPPA